jgi:hypothetical protein
MTQLPLLVSELIGWYQWKAKIEEVNRDYLSRIDYDSQYGYKYGYNRDRSVEYDTFYFYDRDRYNSRGRELLMMHVHYRQWGEYGMKIRHGFIMRTSPNCRGLGTKVAVLPSKYYYSSGSNNLQGFISKTIRVYDNF